MIGCVFAVKVSTHSRLKAAGLYLLLSANCLRVSTHSRLKAAGAVCAVGRRGC